jgi:hypothetical protein
MLATRTSFSESKSEIRSSKKFETNPNVETRTGAKVKLSERCHSAFLTATLCSRSGARSV